MGTTCSDGAAGRRATVADEVRADEVRADGARADGAPERAAERRIAERSVAEPGGFKGWCCWAPR
ncbi:hypothetical protein OIE73_20060 [Streptomyces hirsutus]|uniref:Uncharacterized protein n=1 Tax=Streptomyces hirsutus TaxID=35620 RepID=A0ABZ1GR47_9ACTN|nr:hypothetical protein [Streptomyces hirsutus]WSD07802.1 hypothetical protein OIE73_20060 [Streptomyces hirsutus]